MTRAKTKAPASQVKDAKSTARKSKTTSAKKAKASAADKPANKSKAPINALESEQGPTKQLAHASSIPPNEPSAIQKGRQPKHINSTQAIAMGTAAAGISHLFGWL